MSADVTVREVLPDEYERLAALTVAAYEAVLGDHMSDGYRAELADVAGRAAQVAVLVGIDRGGALVGSITYVPGPGPLGWFDGADDAGLRMLAVAPQAQGRGVGAALVAAGVDRARAAGKRRVLLHTTAPMIGAQRLYERAGFVRDPERDAVVGDGVALLAYVLDLSPAR